MRYNDIIGKFQTFASSEGFIEVKTSSTRIDYSPISGEMISKVAAKKDDGNIEDGYLYVRARAISSRVNKNNDGWPSDELARSYKTFVGRPVFVDHNNSNPSRTRGVIVDAKLHVEDGDKLSALDPYYSNAPDNHKPPTWVEILIEVDAKTYPKLAKAIKEGKIDATSMGANIEKSICSVCTNEAETPSQYCDHIKQKGQTFEITADNGEKVKKTAYEDCYGVNFFEDSFVFDPADITALNLETSDQKLVLAKTAAGEPYNPAVMPGESCPICHQQDLVMKGGNLAYCPSCGWTGSPGQATYGKAAKDYTNLIKRADLGMGGQGVDTERVLNYEPQSDMVRAPAKVDTLKDDIECPECHSDHLEADQDGIKRCPTCGYEQPPEGLDNPDLGKAERQDEKDTRSSDEVVHAGDEDAELQDSGSGPTGQFIDPIKPIGATKDNVATGVISEMIWKRKISTNSSVKANEVLADLDNDSKKGSRRVTAGSVETPIEYSGGIHFGTHAGFTQAGIQAMVTYPGAPQPLPIPGNAMQHFMLQLQAVKAQGLQNPGQLTVRVDAPDEQLDTAVQLIHNGGNLSAVGAAPKPQTKKQVLLPQSKENSDQPSRESVETDQLSPVTSDRRVIKREETPDGHRSEQIIEETGTLGIDDEENTPKKSEKPKVSDEKEEGDNDNEDSEPNSEEEEDNRPDFLKEREREPVAASAEDVHNKLLTALAVAEEAVELGFIPKERKMAFIGMLEGETLDKIEGRRQTMALAKSAGLSKRVAHQSRTTLPRLASAGGLGLPQSNGHVNLDDIPFEAVFVN
jgi:ribosomal protein L37AE/L43A